MILSIVILSYNTPQLVFDCIKSLSSQFEKELKNEEIELLIVDNASEKENIEKLEKHLPSSNFIRLIKNDKNAGFGGGCNLGAKNSKGKYVLFLNSDTNVLDKGFLNMVKFMEENSKVGVLGGKLFNYDGSSQSSSGKFYNIFNFFIMLFGGEKFGLLRNSPNRISETDWVSGACFMMDKELFNKFGGFDENLFMYVEDMEFCYRIKKKGYKVYFFPEVKVAHKEQGSSSRKFAVVNIYKGLLYFYSKHKNKLEFFIVKFSLWLKALIIYLLGRITHNSYYISTYGEALKLF